MAFLGLCRIIAILLALPALLNAQLNASDVPRTDWSIASSADYQAVISTCYLDAYFTDTKQPELYSQVFTEDVVASYSATGNLSIGLAAVAQAQVAGTKGFISQHLLSNFLVDVSSDCMTANASYYAIATLFTYPQQTPGQHANLYGYYKNRLVKTSDGWRINYLQYRFFGPGWTSNLSILTP